MQVGKVIMSVHQQEFNGFRISKHEDAEYLKHKLRSADVQEILANSGQEPYQALLKGYVQSEICFTIVDKEDIPVGMFGVSKEGAIWLLASDDIHKIRFSFLRESRQVVEFLNKKYPILWNYVDCRNELHIRWLKWCGFKFLRKLSYGVSQQPFYEFIRICATQQQH
jgi:hypothetical protein